MHVVESAASHVRVGVTRDATIPQDFRAFLHIGPAHPTGQHRFADGRVLFQRLGALRRRRHGLWREDYQEAVAVVVLGDDLQALGVVRGRGIAEDVDGVGVAPRRRKHAVEPLDRAGRELGQGAAGLRERVASQDARPAGVCEDCQSVALRKWLLRQDVGHFEQVGHMLDAEHARTLECRVEDSVAAGKTPGMGRSRLRCGLRLAALDDDDRLRQTRLASGRQELPGVADGLHVKHDALGAGVIGQIIDHVTKIHIHHGADADHRAEADMLADAPVEHGGDHCTALADECDAAGRGHEVRERGVQTGRRAHQAQAIRPHDPEITL
mmetsp:Transcript_41226/g.119391  ORF Transcript_41226/g.119391 Transcript_41226/m.119391 type:complete len:325 (-) Transcript_41226:539-1513(-)